jgi:transcriptional regulator with XRE-family HTH domain
MRALPKLKGMTSASFATWLGVSPQRWSNFENGKHLGHAVALMLLRKIPGITLDWLYVGERRGVSLELLDRLDAALSAIETTSPTPKKPASKAG